VCEAAKVCRRDAHPKRGRGLIEVGKVALEALALRRIGFGSAQRAFEVGMVNRVVPCSELDRETHSLAARIATMPRFGLALAKRSVNQCEDHMGLRNGMDAVFGLHHFAHAHNAEIGAGSLGGMDVTAMASVARDGVPSFHA